VPLTLTVREPAIRVELGGRGFSVIGDRIIRPSGSPSPLLWGSYARPVAILGIDPRIESVLHPGRRS
jgi:hypothetical protein